MKPCKPVVFLCFAVLFNKSAKARDWMITPKFNFRQIYSDNIGLSAVSQNSAWVTELNPGLRLYRKSARDRFDLNYRLQNIFYVGIDQNPKLYNQLQMNAKSELIKNEIYLDSSSTMGQANINSIGNLAIDNSNTQANAAEFRTLRLSPYWKAHLGGFAVGEARLTYAQVSNSGGVNIGSNIYQQQIYFKSDRYPDSFDWRANLNHQDIRRTGSQAGISGNLTYLNYNGELGLKQGSHYRLFIQAGCYDNNFQDTSLINSVNNGCYELLGASYTPHPKLSLSAGIGNHQSFAALNWTPKARTQLQITYRDSQVGGANPMNNVGTTGSLDTQSGFGMMNNISSAASTSSTPLGGANAGSTWNASFQHQTRRTQWRASYMVSVTTIQQILLESQVFTRPTDAQGNPGEPALNSRPIDQPTLTNDLITRKRSQMSINAFLPKSSASLLGYQENRAYQSAINPPQSILGLTASWNWRFAPLTRTSLQATWQQTEQTNSKNELFNVMLMLTHQISPDLTISFDIRHLQQHSNQIIGQYSENRATANLNVSF